MYHSSRKEQRKLILAHILGCKTDDLKFIGSGHFAVAFEYKGKVYKITDDPDDFVMANKMIKVGHKYPNFVKVYRTAPIEVEHDDYIENLYMIVSEKIKPMFLEDGLVNEIWEEITSANSCCKYVDHYKFEPNLNDNIKRRFNNCELLYTLYNQMVSIAKMYKEMGMEVWDNHNKNLGFVDGKIKIFDMGYSIKGSNYKYSKRRKVYYSIKTELACI